MECIPINETFSTLIIQDGGFLLFVLLALGIVALPIPDETLLVLSGVLMMQGALPIPTTIIAAMLGSMTGITLSYFLGRTGGTYLIHKYGRFLGITEKGLKRAHDWFLLYGKWTLSIGYFIPGVRHFTGISAGLTGLAFQQFAIFAYTGAVFWVSTFLSVGYFFGEFCFSFFELIDKSTLIMIVGFVVVIILLNFLRKYLLK